MQRLIKKLLPFSLAATVILSAFLPAQKVAAEIKVAAATSVANIKQKSRQFFSMKDVNGTTYTAYIFANNEKKKVAGPDDIWAAVSQGDVLYTGDYQVALQKKGSSTVQIQALKIAGYPCFLYDRVFKLR